MEPKIAPNEDVRWGMYGGKIGVVNRLTAGERGERGEGKKERECVCVCVYVIQGLRASCLTMLRRDVTRDGAYREHA